MAKRIGIREAYRMARDNAAAIINAMDLERLYGPHELEDEDVLTSAQAKLVSFIAGRPND